MQIQADIVTTWSWLEKQDLTYAEYSVKAWRNWKKFFRPIHPLPILTHTDSNRVLVTYCDTTVGFSWLCLILYVSFWLFVTLFDSVCLLLTLRDSVWLCVTFFDPVWSCLTLFDSDWPFWICMIPNTFAKLYLTVKIYLNMRNTFCARFLRIRVLTQNCFLLLTGF